MISLLCALSFLGAAHASPYHFELANSLPPYGIPVVSSLPLWEKEAETEKEGETKEVELEKIFPWLAFDKGMKAGAEKEIGFEKSFPFWELKKLGIEKELELEKLFGIGKAIMAFEQALALELYKMYGPYGIWVIKELERRYAIAKELGLIGKEIKLEEAITLGLFKGIGLDKIFESAKAAITKKEFGFEIGKEFAFGKGFKKIF